MHGSRADWISGALSRAAAEGMCARAFSLTCFHSAAEHEQPPRRAPAPRRPVPAQQARRRVRPPRANKVAAACPSLIRVSLRGRVQRALRREGLLCASLRRLGEAREACRHSQTVQAHCIQPLLSMPETGDLLPSTMRLKLQVSHHGKPENAAPWSAPPTHSAAQQRFAHAAYACRAHGGAGVSGSRSGAHGAERDLHVAVELARARPRQAVPQQQRVPGAGVCVACLPGRARCAKVLMLRRSLAHGCWRAPSIGCFVPDHRLRRPPMLRPACCLCCNRLAKRGWGWDRIVPDKGRAAGTLLPRSAQPK